MISNTLTLYSILIGLYSESSSNGFFVDDTAPTFTVPLTQVAVGSLIPLTSVLRSSLKVKWNVVDDESYIRRQYISIVAHRGDEFNTSIEVCIFVLNLCYSEFRCKNSVFGVDENVRLKLIIY